MVEKAGARFLHQQYSDLNASVSVEAASRKHRQETGETLNKSHSRLEAYFTRLEDAFSNPDEGKTKRYKDFYFKVTSNSKRKLL
jgi:hypothetical protein